MIKTVVKRNGSKETFNAEKLNNWGIWAAKTLDPKIVDWSSAVMRVVSLLPEEVTTKELQDSLIKYCLDKDTYEHNIMAGRLYAASLPKEFYPETRTYPTLKELHDRMIKDGVIVKPNYTDEEYEYLNSLLNHELDLTYAHYSLNQIVKKYAMQDRTKKSIYETPQFVYMRVAMQTFNNYHQEDRLEKLAKFYYYVSNRKINIPTPYFANSLTSNPNVASCAVLLSDDTAESIGVTATLGYMLTVAGAGLGVNFKTRSIGDAVRGGIVRHQGKIPYYRGFANMIKSSMQSCYIHTDDTNPIHFLTDEGFKPITEITRETNVAQFDDELNVSYMKPHRVINEPYKVDVGYRFYTDDGSIDITVTHNHRMIYRQTKPMPTDKKVPKGWYEIDKNTIGSTLLSMAEANSFTPTEDMIIYTAYSEYNAINNSFDEIKGNLLKKETVRGLKGKQIHCVETDTGNICIMNKDKNNPNKERIMINGNSRGGAATIYYPFTDPELENLLVLKNPLTVQAKRLREVDYGIILNKWLLKRAAEKKDIYLFSYKDNPELHELLYHEDSNVFGEAMLKFAEEHPDKVTPYPAIDVLKGIVTQQLETGRLYLFFADEVNRHTPYKDTIYSSNLCITGDQYVPSNYGLLTAKELYDLGEIDDLVLFDGEKQVKSSPMKLREKNVPVYEIGLNGGYKHRVTDYHKVMTQRGMVECKDLIVGKDKVIINTKEGIFGKNHLPDEAYIFGLWQGDGTSRNDSLFLDVWEGKTSCLMDEIHSIYTKLHEKYSGGKYDVKNSNGEVVGSRSYEVPKWNKSTKVGNKDKWRLSIGLMAKHMEYTKDRIPRWIREGDKETQLAYIKGLFYTDGTFNYCQSSNTLYLSISSIHIEFLEELQIMLNNLGFVFGMSLQAKEGYRMLPDSNRELKEYRCKKSMRLTTGNYHTCRDFEEATGFITFRGKELPHRDKFYNVNNSKLVKYVKRIENQDVYCPTVETDEHIFIANCAKSLNCNEISLPTKPFPTYSDFYQNLDDPEKGTVAFCNLAGITVDRIDSDEEYAEVAYYCLFMIDEGINNAKLPFPKLDYSIRAWRSAGVGVLGLAHLLAKKGLSYASQEGRNFIHEQAETHAYHLYKAALQLAKERGNAQYMNRTKFPEGWLPIDTYNKNVDELVTVGLKRDWETLRKEIIEQGGIRFTTVSTIPPVESSSISSETSNSIYALREFSLVKYSGDTTNRWVAPDATKLKDKYEIVWELGNKPMIQMYAIYQKFIDQGISADLWVDRTVNKEVSMKEMLQEIFMMAKYGMKGRYYYNTKLERDLKQHGFETSFGSKEEDKEPVEEERGCSSGGCSL